MNKLLLLSYPQAYNIVSMMNTDINKIEMKLNYEIELMFDYKKRKNLNIKQFIKVLESFDRLISGATSVHRDFSPRKVQYFALINYSVAIMSQFKLSLKSRDMIALNSLWEDELSELISLWSKFIQNS